MNEVKKYIFKVIIIGDYACGKTSLLNGYMEKKFNYDYKPTLGANIVKKEFERPGIKASINIWDIAGQPAFKTLHRAFFEASNGVMIVFDVTRPETFDHLPNWHADFKTHVEEDVPGVIVANKIDLEKEVPTEKGKHYADSIGFYYIETSAFRNERVKDAFEYLLAKILPK